MGSDPLAEDLWEEDIQPTQYSCLVNPMDKRAQWVESPCVTESNIYFEGLSTYRLFIAWLFTPSSELNELQI